MASESAFGAELYKIAKQREEHFTAKITNPTAITTHSEYMFVAGQLNILREWLPDMIEEVLENLAKR